MNFIYLEKIRGDFAMVAPVTKRASFSFRFWITSISWYLEGVIAIYNQLPFRERASFIRHLISFTVQVSENMIELMGVEFLQHSFQSAQDFV